MFRSPRRVILGLALLASFAAAPARADEEADDFNTSWIGARLGIFYRPEMNLRARVAGTTPLQPLGLLGSNLDIRDDLGVRQTVQSDYMFQNGILEGEVFFDTRWSSVALWAVAPYEYEGRATLSRTINFGGAQFTASTPVESRFRQFHVGIDFKINIINNRWVRLSPVVAARVLAVDWEVQTLGLKGDTSDIKTPLKYDDAALIPYPELGFEVRVGLRKWFEVDLKVTGSYFTYDQIQGSTISLDFGVTAYPIPFLGLRLGGRYLEYDIRSKDRRDAQDSFDLDLEYLGATFSIIVRFG